MRISAFPSTSASENKSSLDARLDWHKNDWGIQFIFCNAVKNLFKCPNNVKVSDFVAFNLDFFGLVCW